MMSAQSRWSQEKAALPPEQRRLDCVHPRARDAAGPSVRRLALSLRYDGLSSRSNITGGPRRGDTDRSYDKHLFTLGTALSF
jgi:hypothetical protein